MSRKNARETLYKLVFEYLFTKEINEQTEGMLLLDASLSDDDKDYIRKCYQGIAANYDELTARIIKYTTGYASVDRLVKGDLTAMLISAYELAFCPEIPASVSISEAVELVKQFSTSKSSGFVNGVLASINKEGR
ncbi:MAG: transcription antitermination factor NusB [Clostridia bacterium]|nr:transcription antitermination factor NusB [Clostridia bacterium]